MSADPIPHRADLAHTVDVRPDGHTRLPAEMVKELGDRIWFVRGKDRWEAWAEKDLAAALAETTPAAPACGCGRPSATAEGWCGTACSVWTAP